MSGTSMADVTPMGLVEGLPVKEERVRDRRAEGPCRLHVDDTLESRRPCDRNVGNYAPLVMGDGLAPTKDPVLLFRSPSYGASSSKRLQGRQPGPAGPETAVGEELA